MDFQGVSGEGGEGIFEAEKGSSYSRDTDSSLKVTKTRVGKRNQTTKSGFFSSSSPYETAMLYQGTKYQRREGEPENETGEKEGQVSVKWEQGTEAHRRRQVAKQLPSGHSRAQVKENSPSKLFHSRVGFPALTCKTWRKIVTAPVLPCLTMCPQGSWTTRDPHVARSHCTAHGRLPPAAPRALSNIPTMPPAPPEHSGLSGKAWTLNMFALGNLN